MSRIRYDLRQPGELTAVIRQTVGDMLARLAGNRALEEILLVGNTAMHHLLLRPQRRAAGGRAVPLRPKSGERRFTAGELGWAWSRKSLPAFLPCLGGFVGSDLLAGIVATRLHESL